MVQGIQQLKDKGFAACFIFIAPPDISELQKRLRRRGTDDEDKIKGRLEIAEKELEQAKLEGFHDKVFVNDDLSSTYEQLERYIFGAEDDKADSSVSTQNMETSEVVNGDVEMADGDMPAGEGGSRNEVKASAEETTTATDTQDSTSGREHERHRR